MSNQAISGGCANDVADSDESPVERQLGMLDRRLDAIVSLLGDLVERANPVLRAEAPEKAAQSTIREAGLSPIHERLVLLNEKASDLARFVAYTTDRFTI